MILNQQEEYLIEKLRELRPFERITITKDKAGVPDCYLIHREQKILASEKGIFAVK